MATNPNVADMLTGKTPIQAVNPKLPAKPQPLQRVFYRNQGDSTVYDNFGKEYTNPQEFFNAGGKWENVQVRGANPRKTPTEINQLKQGLTEKPSLVSRLENSTFSNVLQAPIRAGQSFLQGGFNTTGAAVNTIANSKLGQKLGLGDGTSKVFDPNATGASKILQEEIYGTDPGTAQTQGRDFLNLAKTPTELNNKPSFLKDPLGFGINKLTTKLSESPTGSSLVGLGLAGLDFTGAGKTKNLTKTLTVLNKVDDVIPVLKKAGVADDLITQYAPALAKATDEKEVVKIVDNLTKQVAPSSTIKPSLEIQPKAIPTAKTSLEIPKKPASLNSQAGVPPSTKSSKIASYEDSITKPFSNKQDAKKAFSQFETAEKPNPNIQRLSDRIEELKTKLEKKDFSTKPKPIKTLSPEELKLKEELERVKTQYNQAKKEAARTPQETEIINLVNDTPDLKDISGFQGQFKDVYRNFRTVFKDKFPQVKKVILDPLDDSKGKYIDDQKVLLDDLDKNIVKGLGIKKGSKESAAVMDYGEGVISKADLTQKFGAEKAGQIIEADKWFRTKYDQLLDEVNAVRKQIYPNNESKLIPKREDYYRHYQELSGWGGLKNIFDTPSAIDPKLSGVSPFTKPRSKFLSFAQKRLGMQSERDAVGGFLNYIPSAAYAKNIDPHVGQFRKLASELADSTTDTRNVNNFIEFLQDYANDLSGKTNPADRYLQKVIPGGRTTMNVVNWLNNRVKANTILGNVSSSLAQLFGIPLGVGSAKQYSVPGFARTVGQIFDKDTVMNRSNFIKERYSGSMYNKFDTKWIDKGRNFAGWVVSVLDELGTKFTWNAHYQKAIAEGIKDPIKYADDTTRALVAGRGVGEVPLAQKAKITQLLAPFQLEVANLWYVLGDQVKAKDFSGIATFLVANYLLNRAVEKVRGSDVSFDPVNSVIDGIQIIRESEDKKKGVLQAVGRQAGEVLSNIPFGQSVAGAYPEFGMNIPGVGKIAREDLFGEGDPTRFGSGLLSIKGLKDPLFKVLPGYGGGQLKKTLEGIGALKDGQVDTKGGEKLFDVENNLTNKIKLPLFGKYSSKEALNYTEQKNSNSKLLKNKLSIEEKEIFDRLQNASREEAKQILLESAQRNEASTEKILDAFEEDKLGITEQDKKMQSLGVKDGKRAQAVWENIAKLPAEEQKKKLVEFAEKKILTDEVLEQVLEFKSGDRTPTFENKEEVPETGLLKTVTTYAKAIGTDPITAFNRIFTGQRIRRLDNGTIIVERMPLTESQKVKSDRGAGDTMILDHTVPLQLGGSNSDKNLNLVEESVWASYTPVENKLGKLLRDKKITKKEAQDLIKGFKEGRISAEEIMNK